MNYEPIDVDAPIPYALTDLGHREVMEIRTQRALWCATAHRIYRDGIHLYCQDCPWEEDLFQEAPLWFPRRGKRE